MAATMAALEALHLYLSARRARGNAYLQIRTFQLIQLLMALPPNDSATARWVSVRVRVRARVRVRVKVSVRVRVTSTRKTRSAQGQGQR